MLNTVGASAYGVASAIGAIRVYGDALAEAARNGSSLSLRR
jgi:hypothetical protein